MSKQDKSKKNSPINKSAKSTGRNAEQCQEVEYDLDQQMAGNANFECLRHGKKLPSKALANLTADNQGELTAFEKPVQKTFEEQNDFRSASTFIESIANEALVWKEALPDGHSPSVLAFLYGGVSIKVKNLTKVSFSGIRIEGEYNGEPCAMLAHQSTVQILCYAPKIRELEKKKPIGFFWDENEVEV